MNEFLEIFTEKTNYLNKRDIIRLRDMIENNFKMTFPKSHSLSYSLIGYWGAYYKTHFNLVFEKVFSQEIKY